MTKENDSFPPPPITDETVIVRVTEGLNTILGTGGPQPKNQDGPIQFEESD